MAEYTLLDADSHVSEPLNLWQERLPVKYRSKAPRMLTEYEGRPGAWWLIEEERHPHNVILGFGGNKTLEELQQFLKGFCPTGKGHGPGWSSRRRSLYHAGFSHVLDQRRGFPKSLFPSLQ